MSQSSELRVESSELKPVRCGCGGEAKVAFCQQSYYGQNCFGDKKIKYRVYMICKKCHARGKPIITDWLINPHPWDSIYSGRIRHNAEQDEMFAPYVERAIEAWNRAMGATDNNVGDKERTAKVETVEKPNVFKCGECGQYFHSTAWGSPVEYCSRCGCRLIWGEDDE